MPGIIGFLLDGRPVEVPSDGATLLEVLRDRLGARGAKDGCSPQGQCGCCTVWVDGQARVACATPAQRVDGRSVTTIDGLEPAGAWAEALCATGGSQCGFCTPGIIMRLASLADLSRTSVDRALLAHLCRCTGWQTIREACAQFEATTNRRPAASVVLAPRSARDLDAAARRAAIEGGTAQRVDAEVSLGRGGFAEDTAPTDALVAVRAVDGSWHVAETLTEARLAAGKVQGRRTTLALTWPLECPEGEWMRRLRTTWVEPAALEPDAAWCEPGGVSVGPSGNGGAFGSKDDTDVGVVARRLADRYGRAVRVAHSREDMVRLGPKRPPLAAGVTADGRGVVRVARTPGIADAIRSAWPSAVVEEVDVAGPRTSSRVRAAGWAEALVVLASTHDHDDVVSPTGARAAAEIDAGVVRVSVRCGRPLDEVVLRSYCIGATHQALGWVRREAISLDADAVPQDLTVRSFGILRSAEMPVVEVTIEPDSGDPVNGSDAVFAAVAAAAWRSSGHARQWPTERT